MGPGRMLCGFARAISRKGAWLLFTTVRERNAACLHGVQLRSLKPGLDGAGAGRQTVGLSARKRCFAATWSTSPRICQASSAPIDPMPFQPESQSALIGSGAATMAPGNVLTRELALRRKRDNPSRSQKHEKQKGLNTSCAQAPILRLEAQRVLNFYMLLLIVCIHTTLRLFNRLRLASRRSARRQRRRWSPPR